ncbi:helix-turn-helix transcriptional regulator [Kibdelosporangium banguiense]|nr:helix-turn-helix transcriptional regulator [Kibdelosporangium banguiense]
MDREYASALGIDDLARSAGCSRYHFVRSFRAAYGETPGRYLTMRRIERAKDLLRSANLTVTEICMLVGFSSLGSFSSRFTAVVGMPPSQYRAAHPAAAPIPGCFLMTWTRPAILEKASPAGPD